MMTLLILLKFQFLSYTAYVFKARVINKKLTLKCKILLLQLNVKLSLQYSNNCDNYTSQSCFIYLFT